MNMRENILEAVWNKTFPNWPREESNGAFEDALLRIIDTVLDAMREPTRGVWVAGENVNEYEYGDSERGCGGGYIDPTPAWQAMIDAIKAGK